MLTRSRSILQLAQLNDETVNEVSTHEKKKRTVKSSENAHKSKRSNIVDKIEDKQPTSKRKSNVVLESLPSVSGDNSSNFRKSPPKLKRTRTVSAKSKASKAYNGAQQETNDFPSTTEETDEVVTCYNAIKPVLAANYMNVQKRLNLFYPAKCVQSLVKCKENHMRNQVSMFENDVM